MRTRDRILEQARVLFNDQGVARVALNQIALDLGISAGNLHYHFNTRAKLLSVLLSRFERAVEEIASAAPNHYGGIDDFWLYLHLLLEVCLRYRFALRDLDQVLAETVDAPPCLQRIRGAIEHAMAGACKGMQQGGLLEIDDELSAELAVHLSFIVCCWPNFELLARDGNKAGSALETTALRALAPLAPYLDPNQRTYLRFLRNKYRPVEVRHALIEAVIR